MSGKRVAIAVAATFVATSPLAADDNRTSRTLDLAVIGDTPYGTAQAADFPNLIAAINADPTVSGVVHVGDIKNGSSRCDNPYFETIRAQLDTFVDPLVYTPGDNEWTDCHRTNNGKYDPLERLSVVRTLFFPAAGVSLGTNKRHMFSQAWVSAHRTFIENNLWAENDVVFATVHAVGSNNGLLPWFEDDLTDALVDDPARRTAEVEARTAAATDWLDKAFGVAKFSRAKGIAIFMQADTWDGIPETLDGLTPIVRRLADLAADFRRPVLLVQGDSHVYLADKPLELGDPVHGVTRAVPNLTRIVVQGSNTTEWLKLRIDPRKREVFSWQRMLR